MAYQPWSVVFGETPSASKWNILGTNDAGFNDGTAIGAGAIGSSQILDASILPADLSSAARWWEELGRATAGGAVSSLTVSSFTTKKYLMVILNMIGSGNIGSFFTFNGDTAANYASRVSTNGAADSTAASQTGIQVSGTAPDNESVIGFIYSNIAAQEKVGSFMALERGTAGAANVPVRREVVGKWANTSAQISTIAAASSGAGTFQTGSELIILGHD